MSKRFRVVQRVEFIKTICDGRKVLHLGCTNYPYTQDSIDNNMLLHLELAKSAKQLVGFDFDAEGLEILTRAGVGDLYQADAEALESVPLKETFDVIVAGEMIEHLSNPGKFLNGIQRFMDPKTDLVLTTVNAYCALRFLIYGLRGKGGEQEPVHPDHVAYYSYRTLSLILDRSGLRMKDFLFYDIGIEHRPFNRWIYNVINDVSVRFFPQFSDGVIAVVGLK
jgi:SAM-dependent methyltransferase